MAEWTYLTLDIGVNKMNQGNPIIKRGAQSQIMLRAAIMGGNACHNLLILLSNARLKRLTMKIVGLADPNPNAPGIPMVKGIEIAGRMIKRIKDKKMCDGVHIMAIGKEEVVPDIMPVVTPELIALKSCSSVFFLR